LTVGRSNAQDRQQILDSLGRAADELAMALACLGEAHAQLDDIGAERLEDELFRPAQLAYGRAQRTHADFAARSELPARPFQAGSPGPVSHRPQELVERGVDAVRQAGETLAELQDSMLPVEVGDPALRAGLAGVRELIDGLPRRAREIVRTLGR
jgi:hypothetical protein